MSMTARDKGFASVISLLIASTSTLAMADEGPTFNAKAATGLRFYTEDGLYSGQSSSGAELFVELGLDGHFNAGNGKITFSFDGLLEETDTRNLFNIGELHFSQSFGNWDILAGFHTENWGVAESRSIVNVMNPIDRSNPTENDQLLGTPMVNLNLHTNAGTFSAYALLGFIEPHFGDGDEARFRSPVEFASRRANFEEGDDRHVDYALRYSHNFNVGNGALDVSASYFNGTSREAVTLPGCANTNGGDIFESVCNAVNDAIAAAYDAGIADNIGDADDFFDFLGENLTDDIATLISTIPIVGLVPYYQKIEQVGLTAVYSNNDLQLRFEGIYREAQGDDFFAAVVGGDYTFTGIGGGAGDLTVALEYLYDDRAANQPLTLFEDDIFLGLNYRFNNARDTSITFGMFHDLDSQAQLFNAGVSTRLSDSIRLDVNASHVSVDSFNDPLAFIKDDTFVEFKFTAFF